MLLLNEIKVLLKHLGMKVNFGFLCLVLFFDREDTVKKIIQ